MSDLGLNLEFLSTMSEQKERTHLSDGKSTLCWDFPNKTGSAGCNTMFCAICLNIVSLWLVLGQFWYTECEIYLKKRFVEIRVNSSFKETNCNSV